MRRLAMLLGLLPLPAVAAPCVGPVCNMDTLAPYFARLAAVREARGERPVHILQIGDSHTAGDALTGAWRDLLQAKAGSGGRGVLAPGRPYAGYFTRGVTASTSDGWAIAATFGPGSAAPRPPLGLASYSLTATRPGVSMGLTAEPGMEFDRVVICAIAGPGAGALTVRMADGERRIDLAADVRAPRCETIRAETPQSSLEVIAVDTPVTITSWATFRDDGGVALSNLGVVGSQIAHFGRTDDAVLAEELRAYAPDLIVLAFGTNEGFSPRLDVRGYAATLRAEIERLRRLAPGVPILLLGAPDALTRNQALRANAEGVVVGCPDGADKPLFAPPALGRVRGVQREVAGEAGVAYWDWQARMGGICSARRWVDRDPPLMREDHVHFRTAGGKMLARLLEDDLEAAAGAR